MSGSDAVEKCADLTHEERYEWRPQEDVIAKFGYTTWYLGDLWSAFDHLQAENARMGAEIERLRAVIDGR